MRELQLETWMKGKYGRDFYADRHQKTVYSARTILSLVLKALPPVHSAIDFGCGVGTWLSVLQEQGVSEIRGLDGPWVDQSLLEIPKEDFRNINFEEKIVPAKRYDLAISLEVAEHVSKDSAGIFIDSLIAASDFVLFSAAIPSQGGVGHVNEQWPDYWIKLFAGRNYVAFDFVRKKIWSDDRIPFWYRQNILLFAKNEAASHLKLGGSGESEISLPTALVHPDLYLSKTSQMSSIMGGLGILWRAARPWGRKR